MTTQAPRAWRVVARDTVADCRVFRVQRLRSVREAAAGEPDDRRLESDFYCLDSKDFVNVVALTEDDEIVLVEQYRHGSAEMTLEVPGGLIDAGEDPIAAGLRELVEETGYGGGSAEILGVTRPNPAIQSNRLTTILVRGAKPITATAFDEHEECAVHVLPFATAVAKLDSGEIDHALVVVAMAHELRRRARLAGGGGL